MVWGMPWLDLKGLFGPSKVERARQAERFRTERITSSIGAVVDLSASGARLCTQDWPGVRKGQVFTLSLANNRVLVPVPCRVAWVKRIEKGPAHEIGVAFVEIRKELAAALESLARYGFIPSDLLPPEATVHEVESPGQAEAKQRAKRAERVVPKKQEVEDLYGILQVSAGASEAEIRKAYRAMARLLHPDQNPGPDAAALFAKVNKAYVVLRDAELRRRYDQMRDESQRAA
jgi:hypothetical protein